MQLFFFTLVGFFVVTDVKLHGVDLLLLKPVHAVSNRRIQISVCNLLWWQQCLQSDNLMSFVPDCLQITCMEMSYFFRVI